jgi:Cu/Ag efflux pump CusA
MRALVGWSMRFRHLVVLVAAGLLVVGAMQLRDMSADVLPEFTPPYVEVQTEALGLSAAEVEELITVPLEGDLLNGVAGIEVIRSESVAGLSRIVLIVEPGTDVMNARQLVQERLTQAHALPNVSKPPAMLQPLSSSSRVLMVGLRSDEISLIDLGLLARWTIRPRLLGVPGVANVAMWGQREHQLQVQVDPERLQERDVSLEQIISTAGNSQLVSSLSFLEGSTPGSGGFIDTPNQRLQVRHILPIATPAGLARVPVVGTDDLRLGDVTTIVEDHQPLIGDAAVGDSEGLLLVVEKFPGANTLEVTRGVEEALDALRPGLAGVEVDSGIFRRAGSIEAAIDNVTWALLAGLILLVLVLFAFTFEWRAVVVAIVSMVLSLVAAALVLALRGVTMNGLLLAGLVVAVVVVADDAIVGVESIQQRLRALRNERRSESRADVVLAAVMGARSPLAYATAILLLAVAPVVFLEGVAGAFFEPLAVSFVLAVLVSLAIALTVTPALSLLLMPNTQRDGRQSPIAAGLRRGYSRALGWTLPRPLPVAAVLGVLGLLAVASLAGSERALVPTFKDLELVVRFDGAPGTSRPAMTRITTRVGRELRDVPGVQNVGAHVGRAVLSDQITGINAGEVWVTVEPDADYDSTFAAIQDVVAGYPGIRRELVTYSRERMRAVGALSDGSESPDSEGLEALRGEDEPVVVRVYGHDLDLLREKAAEVRRTLAAVDGVVAARVESQPVEPTLEIQVDLEAAGRIGMRPGDVRRAAATLVHGIAVGSLFEEQKVFDVVVVGVPDVRASLTSVRNLLLEAPSGERVRLGDVADIRVKPAPVVIEREAASRRLDVAADIQGRDLGSVLADVDRRLGDIAFPLEYHAEVRSESRERQAADRRVLAVAVAVAIGIFLILQAAFGSWRLAGVFLLTLPFAVSGGILAAFVAGGPLSLGALLGLFAVLALTIRNGILVIARCQEFEPSPEHVIRGAEESVISIATSVLAVGALVLPLVVLGGRPGLEILHPLAVVTLGGLVTSTLYSLLVMPALYARVAPRTRPEREELATQPAGSRLG